MDDTKTWVFKVQGDDRQYSVQAKTETEAYQKINSIWMSATVLQDSRLWGYADLSDIIPLDTRSFSAYVGDR